ncbi:hypothetical protein J1605_016312 [Eschrichtius robustus]|uniref:C2H2-type domain-containing protein n=1 Tax=Eschrichtius robustus TaxID=9764 RepID=A0AB34G8J3_ESCRO|nr:hypothetical protein J1605_016312 [Eschrichtius robustus]
MRIRVAGSAAAPSPPVNGEPGEPAVYLDRKAPGGDEAEAPALVQLIDEHGTYSTARLVPDGSAEERSGKREPGSLRSGSEGREGLARPRQSSCAACGRAFKRAWELLSHEVVPTAARPFRCGLCAAAFKRRSDCKSHRLVHGDERPHGCDACGKRSKRATNLQGRAPLPLRVLPEALRDPLRAAPPRAASSRLEPLHAPSRPFPCRGCGKAFAAEPALLLHRRQHCEGKPHACRVCSKRFTHRHRLRVHERVHTGDRPFLCPLCAKAFKQSDPLASHLRVHSGVRLYPCATCGKAFKQSSYLAIHRRMHTGERPYPCDGCSKAFSRPSLLLQHRRAHSPVRPHACRFCPKHFKDLNYRAVHEKSPPSFTIIIAIPTTAIANITTITNTVTATKITPTRKQERKKRKSLWDGK